MRYVYWQKTVPIILKITSMDNKNYTSIEQSKHLLELGLKPGTCDKVWVSDKGAEVEFTMDLLDEEDYDKYVYTYPNDMYIPCWSVGALLELMPSHLGEFEDGIDFGLSKAFNNKWFCAHYLQMKEDDNGKLLMKSIITVTGKTPIEALYKIVCWLIENNYIEKGD